MVESNIHTPYDSELLVDSVRVLTRLMVEAKRELPGGASNLILDCVVFKGNPADSELTGMMLDRQDETYGCYPLKTAFDGGFTSHTNLEKAKNNGVRMSALPRGVALLYEFRYYQNGANRFPWPMFISSMQKKPNC